MQQRFQTPLPFPMLSGAALAPSFFRDPRDVLLAFALTVYGFAAPRPPLLSPCIVFVRICFSPNLPFPNARSGNARYARPLRRLMGLGLFSQSIRFMSLKAAAARPV